jgi:phage regulator Rha-like protein
MIHHEISPKVSLRDLLWLIVVVVLSVLLWKQNKEISDLHKQHQADIAEVKAQVKAQWLPEKATLMLTVQKYRGEVLIQQTKLMAAVEKFRAEVEILQKEIERLQKNNDLQRASAHKSHLPAAMISSS